MIIREVGWIRSHIDKLCPVLRKQAMEWYRPARYAPCFTQRPLRRLMQRWRRIPVIVQTDESAGTLSLDALTGAAKCRVKRKLALINAFSTEVNAESLKLLAENEQVRKVWYDSEVRAVLDVASPTVNAKSLWDEGFTGKEIVVAVLDTGIYEHPDLSGRIIGFKDFIKDKVSPYDDNGHGTHVAGCIAADGKESGVLYRAPAPDACLVGVKVLNKAGMGSLSTVIDGVQWCIASKEKHGIRILNLSLGSQANMSYREDPVCLAVEKAWQAGLVVCVAAGNDGPDTQTIGSPAIHPDVITVGASDDMNTEDISDDRVAVFSSRGPTRDGLVKPDFLAPGVDIVALRSPGSLIDKQNKKARIGKWYTTLSGTSMATPVCAGVAAQLLQVDGSLTPDMVKQALGESARKIGDLDVNVQGAGIIDGLGAAEIARTLPDG